MGQTPRRGQSLLASSCIPHQPFDIATQRAEGLLSELLPSSLAGAAPLLLPYLITSFGSFTRLDYGTGHETSFALFLLSLALIRFFEIDGERGPVKSSARSAGPLAPTLNMLAPQPEERAIVLRVFVRYLKLCWRLQDVYRLEPAGSHGVWGLDDYAFLGYIFGSAQLRGIPERAIFICCDLLTVLTIPITDDV